VAQEALTNALRHSTSATVTISLHGTQDEVVLAVRDFGTGLPAGGQDGNGLRGMRERALLIGATLQVRSAPGEGVQVVLTVPVRAGA
jgi:two-component system sensor histidine kinase UhpB